MIRLCERAAVPWGARGGRVVSVSPGLIDTGMGRLELDHYPIKETMAEITPVRAVASTAPPCCRGASTTSCGAVVFLCSDAASFVSGCDLRVDGGLVAAMYHPGRPMTEPDLEATPMDEHEDADRARSRRRARRPAAGDTAR